jgi:quercetin dioxygenase-like cupin family protein
MTTRRHSSWMTGWTADDPLEIGFTHVRRADGAWVRGERPQLELRDLGLEEATGGKMGVMHVRRATDEPVDDAWHCHDLDFQFTYVLAGSVVFQAEHADEQLLQTGDSLYCPGLLRHREHAFSRDFEAVHITGPARGQTIVGLDAPLPDREGADELQPVCTFERPESYAVGDGPRKFFAYRDLGTRGPTDGRIHIHVVRATGTPGDGTGWHYHSMAQWFMILGGSSHIRVEDGPNVLLEPLDTMCIGAGPRMRHNVAPYSGDYAVLEMCVPAEYETVTVAPPEGAAAPPTGARE